MASRILNILIVTLAGGYWIAMSSGCRASVQQTPVVESMWRVDVTLDVPILSVPSVEVCTASRDPVPLFVARIKQVRDIYKTQSPEIDLMKIERLRSVEMSVNWEQAIHDVLQGDDGLRSLTPTGHYSSSSSSAAGKKWIVTTVVQHNGKPICWYLPVEVHSGEGIKVTLTEDNAFDIGSLYDHAMQQ